MKTINTTIGHADSDENINLELKFGRAFSDVFGLGLLLNSKHPTTGQFATDATGLHIVKDHLEYVHNESLFGLSGIGALLSSANPVDLGKEDMDNIGSLVRNLVRLAEEANDHLASVNTDIKQRAGLITDPAQAATHAEVHIEALQIRKTRSMSYLDAVSLAAGRLAAQKANPDLGEV